MTFTELVEISNVFKEYPFRLILSHIPMSAPSGEYTKATLLLFKTRRDAYDFTLSLYSDEQLEHIDDYDDTSNTFTMYRQGGESFTYSIEETPIDEVDRIIKTSVQSNNTILKIGYCSYKYGDYNSLIVRNDFNSHSIEYISSSYFYNFHRFYNNYEYILKIIYDKILLFEIENYDVIYIIQYLNGKVNKVDTIYNNNNSLVKSAIKTI
jgi:hypothetical protein